MIYSVPSTIDGGYKYIFLNFNFFMLFLQCKLLRDYYVSRPKEKKMMSEKVRAGILFKGKKSLYEQRLDQTHTHCLRSLSLSSVSQSFQTDRAALRSDDRWSRIVAETNEQRIVWSDRAHKLNRKDGKVNSKLLYNCQQTKTISPSLSV